MGKAESILGYETLLHDLMLNSAQLADYLGISRYRLAHIVSGRNKPGNGIITELSKLASKLDDLTLHPQTLENTASLSEGHQGEVQSELAAIILKLHFG
jgi:transcriptional regulator with XRE-family HTH domain